MNRAYSLLTVKALDADQRVIRGVATTPEPDRVGDVVEPLGVQFKNPLPLLLYHDAKKPVGWVKFQKPTKDGIDFEAKLPTIEEPGTVRDRVEEAWTSLKTGLIAGVSIGFRSLEDAFLKDTGGIRFLRTEVMELSLVTIPAHPGAVISTVKQLDLEQRSALRSHVPSPAGVPASPRPAGRREFPMNLNEQIVSLTETRKVTAARMSAIMSPVVANEGDLDEAQTKEYDTLVKTLNETDARIERLEALERAQMPTIPMVGVAGQTEKSGHGARGGWSQVSVSEPTLPPGIAFTRAAICKIAARQQFRPAFEIAKERYPSHPSIATYLKTTIPGGTTTGTGSGSPQTGWGDDLLALNTTFAGGFMDYLRPKTIVGRLNLTRVPFNTRVQSQTTGGSARWVGQGLQKPVTKYDFDALNLGFAKIAAICVLSDELIRFSSPSAETLVRDALANTIIEKIDRDFIDPDVAAVANVSPASITRGATVLASAGASVANANTDIQSIIGQFITNNQNLSNLAWIMPNSLALSLSLMLNSLGNRAFPGMDVNGGTLAGYPVVASQYATGISTSPTDLNLVILLNQSEIFLADDGQVTVDASDQASIEMSDDPATDAGNVMVSMYQTNQVALRAERYINWARGRTTSVIVLGDVRWSA